MKKIRGIRTEDAGPPRDTWQDVVIQTCEHEPPKLGDERGFDLPLMLGTGIRMGLEYVAKGWAFVVVGNTLVRREGIPNIASRIMVKFVMVPGVKA